MNARAYLTFVPWAIFLIVDRTAGPGIVWATGFSMVASVALLLIAVRAGDHRFFWLLQIGVMLAVLLTHLGLGQSADGFDRYARTMVTGALGLSLAATLLRTPAAADSVRSLVPPDATLTPAFQRLVRTMTARWAGTALLIGTVCGAATVSDGALARTIGDWILPLAGFMCLLYLDGKAWHGFHRTIRLADELGGTAHPAGALLAPERRLADPSTDAAALAPVVQLPIRDRAGSPIQTAP